LYYLGQFNNRGVFDRQNSKLQEEDKYEEKIKSPPRAKYARLYSGQNEDEQKISARNVR